MLGVDIASGKPVTASSVYNNYYRPEYLTNGESCKDGNHPAASTKEENKPWFKIDLQGKFYIRTVTVTPRRSKFTETKFIINRKEILRKNLLAVSFFSEGVYTFPKLLHCLKITQACQ